MTRKQKTEAVLAWLILAMLVLWCWLDSCATQTSVTTNPLPVIEGEVHAASREPQTKTIDAIGDARLNMWTERDAELIAKTVYGEARSRKIPTGEKAAVVWCILNRVDAGWGTIEEVVTAREQFHGYKPGHPVDDELYELTLDVLHRWQLEHDGAENVGRTLPKEYLYFVGRADGRNHFKIEWRGRDCWDWSLGSPYEEQGGKHGRN